MRQGNPYHPVQRSWPADRAADPASAAPPVSPLRISAPTKKKKGLKTMMWHMIQKQLYQTLFRKWQLTSLILLCSRTTPPSSFVEHNWTGKLPSKGKRWRGGAKELNDQWHKVVCEECIDSGNGCWKIHLNFPHNFLEAKLWRVIKKIVTEWGISAKRPWDEIRCSSRCLHYFPRFAPMNPQADGIVALPAPCN